MDSLDDIFYYGEKEDSPDVLKKVLVASGLLAKAQQLESKKIIKDKEQILQYKEADTERKDIMIDALQNALIEKMDKAQDTSRDNICIDVTSGRKSSNVKIAKSSELQESEDGEVITIDRTCKLLKYNTKKVSLSPIQIQLLDLLFKNTDNLVTRNYILNNIWEGADVYDRQITDHISKIKKAFTELGFDKEIIETINVTIQRKNIKKSFKFT